MNKKVKTIIIGMCLILSGISTCTYNTLNENGKPIDNISQGVIEVQKGIDIIKTELEHQ